MPMTPNLEAFKDISHYNARKLTQVQQKPQNLGQHFTSATISKLIVNRIPVSEVKLVVDLAVGRGELLWHAKQRWPDCQVAGFDIDRQLIQHCRTRFGQENVFKWVDVLRVNLEELTNYINGGSMQGFADVILGNPPFGIISTNDLDENLLHTLDVYDLFWTPDRKCNKVQIEIAFFIQCIELVSKGGYIAVLMPESIVSGEKLERFRKFLVNNFALYHIISFPACSFNSSEAKTCVLIARKKKVTKSSGITHLAVMDSTASDVDTTDVSQNDLIARMDPSYHIAKMKLKNETKDLKPLGAYIDYCVRGHGLCGSERALLKKNGDHLYVHSVNVTDFSLYKSSRQLAISNAFAYKHPQALIHEGDVLIVRVGKGCAGRCAVVNGIWDNGFASDCVYIIRSNSLDPYYLCLYLNTPFSKQYLDAARRGKCSQYLTKSDLMALPFFLPNLKTISELSKEVKNMLDRQIENSHKDQQLSGLINLTILLDALIRDNVHSDGYSYKSLEMKSSL